MGKRTECFEAVDASVFSSDMLHTDLAEFKEYLGRWNKAVQEHEESLTEEEKEIDQLRHENKWLKKDLKSYRGW